MAEVPDVGAEETVPVERVRFVESPISLGESAIVSKPQRVTEYFRMAEPVMAAVDEERREEMLEQAVSHLPLNMSANET